MGEKEEGNKKKMLGQEENEMEKGKAKDGGRREKNSGKEN